MYTIDLKIIHDYTGLSFAEILELPVSLYFLYRRDGFIYEQYQKQGGKEYLEKCWTLEQTEPDREALRKKFGKG